MADEHGQSTSPDSVDDEAKARREFLKRIGAASVAVPAVTLLLAANFKRAAAQVAPYNGGCGGCGSGCGCGGTSNP